MNRKPPVSTSLSHVLLFLAIVGAPVFARSQAAPEADFGAVNIGSASPAKTLTFTFGSAATLASTHVVAPFSTGLPFAWRKRKVRA
jgi:hypothetical protein